MAHFGNQTHCTDLHGNAAGHGTAGYGDHPSGGHGVHHIEHGTGGHALGVHGEHQTVPNAAGGVGGLGTGECRKKVVHGDGATGALRRSGSSSSSSSEDDGLGGRRKKGIKEKVKEKLPGGGHNRPADDTPHHLQGAAAAPQEKKGIVEKVKEKLPGNH